VSIKVIALAPEPLEAFPANGWTVVAFDAADGLEELIALLGPFADGFRIAAQVLVKRRIGGD